VRVAFIATEKVCYPIALSADSRDTTPGATGQRRNARFRIILAVEVGTIHRGVPEAPVVVRGYMLSCAGAASVPGASG
jgi:hypothetical protein